MSKASQITTRVADDPLAGPLRRLPPTAGLHTLGAHLQVAESEPHAREILHRLPEALAISAAAAPVRVQKYLFEDRARTMRQSRELAWASALWQQYGPSGPGRWLLFERCDRLLGIGVRLRDERRGRHWDRVDLVGVDTERTPVVIELKGTRGQATPLRAAIDATAYGLAIRKAWPHRLRGDWLDALKAAGFGEPRLPVFLNRLTVLIAAPEAYWQDRIGGPETGTRGSVSTAAWQALHDLTDALVPQGFDVVFASLRARSVRGRQPVGVTAWPQHIPRMGR